MGSRKCELENYLNTQRFLTLLTHIKLNDLVTLTVFHIEIGVRTDQNLTVCILQIGSGKDRRLRFPKFLR